MRPENEIFIRINREKLHGLLHLGRVKKMQIEEIRRVVVEEFLAVFLVHEACRRLRLIDGKSL